MEIRISVIHVIWVGCIHKDGISGTSISRLSVQNSWGGMGIEYIAE